MIKNRACTVTYTAWSSTGNVKTGDVAYHSVYLSKDGATPAAATYSPLEVGNGTYKVQLTAAETNCDLLTVMVNSATSGVIIPPVNIVFHNTQDMKADVSGLATAAALSTLQTSVNAIPTTTYSVPTVAQIQNGLATAAALSTLQTSVNAIPTTTYSVPTASQVAQAVLKENVTTVEATAPTYSLGTVILATLNAQVNQNSLVIKKTDGTTHTTRAITTTANAAPISSIGDEI